MKNTRIILSSDTATTHRMLGESSSRREQMILRRVKQKFDLIKENPHHGDPIAKRMIPQRYASTYGITNLFRVELPSYWRMLYTLTGDGDDIVAFILDIIDHKMYDKLFGYRKK
ncbi:MAG: hypothetical protein ABIH41_06445 [Nanoarchaeota archaeon]